MTRQQSIHSINTWIYVLNRYIHIYMCVSVYLRDKNIITSLTNMCRWRVSRRSLAQFRWWSVTRWYVCINESSHMHVRVYMHSMCIGNVDYSLRCNKSNINRYGKARGPSRSVYIHKVYIYIHIYISSYICRVFLSRSKRTPPRCWRVCACVSLSLVLLRSLDLSHFVFFSLIVV